MTIVGVMRARNAERWLPRSLASLGTCADRLLVLDDHSEDGTALIARELGAEVLRTRERLRDEARERQLLYDAAGAFRPDWVVAIDADEVITDPPALRSAMIASGPTISAFALRVLYLWEPGMIRTDGVYGQFWRRSAMRYRPGLRYHSTRPWGLHCGVLPGDGRLPVRSAVALLHYGYETREQRLAKYQHYCAIDPDNEAEDRYRHMVIGDLLPPETRTRYAGPLKLEPLERVLGVRP